MSAQYGVVTSVPLASFTQRMRSITPAVLPAGDTNNYSPAEGTAAFYEVQIIRQATNASGSTLTGLDASRVADGQFVVIENLGTGTLTLAHESTSSLVGNRFTLPSGSSLAIGSGSSAWLIYDGTSARWRIGSSGSGSVTVNIGIVQLSAAPYNVISADPAVATARANGAAIRQAIADHPTNTTFLLPMGDTYVSNVGNTGTYRFAAININGAGKSGLTISGWGVGASRLIMTDTQSNGLSQIIQIADGPQRITLRDFSILHSNSVTNYDTVGLQNHHIELNAINADVKDVEIYNVWFGPCIGDAIRNAGGSGTFLINTRVHHVTMRLAGLSFLPLGCRSGISFQKGIRHYYFNNFYIHGPKNSPLDFEPTASSVIDNIHLADGTLDNTGGQTIIAGSFTGYDNGAGTVAPVTNSSMARVRVVEGQLQCVNTENCVLDNVTVYGSGLGPMASQLSSDPMLYVYKENRNLRIENVNIHRDVGSVAGQLCLIQHATLTSPKRVSIEGGEWRAGTNSGTSGVYVRCEAIDGLHIDGLRIRVDGTATASERAILLRPNTTQDITDVDISNVHIQSETAKVGRGIELAAISRSISQVQICDVNLSDCTTGVYLDASGGGTVDRYPVIQGCDFTGCTNTWTTANSAINSVFPVVGGNRAAVAIFEGDPVPESNVTATQGSIYTRRNGDSTKRYYKSTGASNTGWIVEGGAVATGSITCIAKASLVDGETVAIPDGLRPAVVYEFDTNAAVSGTNIRVDISADTTAAQVAARLAAAITAQQPGVTVTDLGTGVLNLAHNIPGAFANINITETVVNAGFTVTGMSGGANPAR